MKSQAKSWKRFFLEQRSDSIKMVSKKGYRLLWRQSRGRGTRWGGGGTRRERVPGEEATVATVSKRRRG